MLLKLPEAMICQSSPTVPRNAAPVIAVDVVDLQTAGRGVAQNHIAGAAAGKIPEHRLLPS
jgi:hypothetical protein